MFRLEPFVAGKAQPVPFKRRPYFKIMLVIENSHVHLADKVVLIHSPLKMQPSAKIKKHTALANAIFAGTGKQIRKMPIDLSNI